MNLKERFQKQVLFFLEEGITALPYVEIESRFRTARVLTPANRSEQFRAILQAYLTALMVQRWNYCCLDHGIEVKEIQSLFFKTVMEGYASLKGLEEATAFSEAMYAANSQPEEPGVFVILVAFFKKMNLKEAFAVSETAELFKWLAAILEAYRNHFDNEFDDFIGQLRLDGVLEEILKKKK